jgi:hypothetical protein
MQMTQNPKAPGNDRVISEKESSFSRLFEPFKKRYTVHKEAKWRKSS